MKAAIYARKSTDQSGISDEQRSVARQVEPAHSYATGQGWRVLDEHVYVDEGISGAEFANRPGFLRLMNALKPRAPFQVLVMSEESRLGREARDLKCCEPSCPTRNSVRVPAGSCVCKLIPTTAHHEPTRRICRWSSSTYARTARASTRSARPDGTQAQR